MLKLNETPVRTTRNYNINNIKLENVLVPKNILEFNNVRVSGDVSKFSISDEVENKKLTFGIGEEFINQINEKSNCKLKIDINSKVSKELILNFDLDEMNDNLLESLEINLEEDATANIYVVYNSEVKDTFHNGLIYINSKKNSNLKLFVLNYLSDTSNNFISIEDTLEDNAKIDYTVIDLGAKNSISNIYSNMKGTESDTTLNTIYIGSKTEIIDMNYIAELRGEKSNVVIDVQGALKDEARKHFKGTIDFKKGSKKAKGDENEYCTLLSDKARSLALPMLLCSEEDVEGNHSSAAGKVGEKELFYIMTRGFDKKAAEKLLVRAKFNKIIEKIKNDEIKNRVIYEIENRLD